MFFTRSPRTLGLPLIMLLELVLGQQSCSLESCSLNALTLEINEEEEKKFPVSPGAVS